MKKLLIGTLTTNGNEIITLPEPTYTNHTKTEYKTHGLITSTWFLERGLGYRSPN